MSIWQWLKNLRLECELNRIWREVCRDIPDPTLDER